MKTTPPPYLIKLSVLAGALLCATQAFAYDANIWQPVDGDWNGRYSDARHWSRGHLPDIKEGIGEDAIFPCKDFDYTVTIDCSIGEGGVPIPAFFKIGQNEKGGGSGWVRFDGSGTIRQSLSNDLHIYATNQVEFAGNLTLEKGVMTVDKGASLRFAGNCSKSVSGNLTLNDGSDLEIAGGDIRTGFLFEKDYEHGSVRVTGGSIVLTTDLKNIPPCCDFSFTGGRISTSFVTKSERFFPRGTGVLTSTINSTGAIQITNEIRRASGDVCSTNTTSIGLRFDDNATFWGGNAHWMTGWFLPFGGGKDYVFGVSRIDIGGNYYPSGSANIVYPTDLTIGAWGDFNIQATAGNRFYGRMTFDSTDAIDGTTARTFTFKNLVPGVGASCAFTGSGSPTVVISVPSGETRLRAIEVDANSSARIEIADSRRRLKVPSVKLGANARLIIDPNQGALETLTTPELGDGAKITLDLSNLTVSTDGTTANAGLIVRAVLSDMAGVGLPDSAFELVNMPAGKAWTLKRVDGAVYLQDANATPLDDTQLSGYTWVGGKTDNLTSTDENWSGGAAPAPTGTPDLHFRFDALSTRVEVPAAGQTMNQLGVGGRTPPDSGPWRRCGPPYVFSGGKISLNRNGGDYNSALWNYSRQMLVIKNDLYFKNNNMMMLTTAPLVLAGTVTAKADANVRIKGDVRVSGSMTFADYQSQAVNASYENDLSSLTALPGGTITALKQVSAFAEPMILTVAAGGTILFAADGQVSYTGTAELEHFVDGALTFAAPLSIAANQTFGGKGTVSFSSVTAGDGAGVILADGITAAPAEMSGSAWTVRNGSAVTICPSAAISGAAPVTVKTDATLTLEGADNDVSWGALKLEAGSTFAKKGSGSLTLSSLTVEEDTAISIDGAVGTDPVLTVDGDVSLKTCSFALSSAAAKSLPGSWTDIVRVSAGHAVQVGTLVGEDCRLRVSADGRAIQGRGKGGLLLIVR